MHVNNNGQDKQNQEDSRKCSMSSDFANCNESISPCNKNNLHLIQLSAKKSNVEINEITYSSASNVNIQDMITNFSNENTVGINNTNDYNYNQNLNYNRNSDNEDKISHSASTHSNKISIVSLDNGLDSSVVDSDEDYEDPVSIPIGNTNEFVVKKLNEQYNHDIKNDSVIFINQKFDDTPKTSTDTNRCNGIVAAASAAVNSSHKPQIGNVAVQNSTDITFGNKTFYHGPVTIKQFVLEKTKYVKTRNGKDNPAFEDDCSSKINRRNNTRYEVNSGLAQTKNFLNNKFAISITSILVVLVIGAIVFTTQAFLSKPTVKNSGDGDDSRKNIPISSIIDNDNISDGSILRIITRDEWLAEPPRHELDDLILPAYRVIIAHTATDQCYTQAACTFRVRFIQTFHIESRNFDDIGYNFLVGGDGAVYEGRGWNKQGAHTKGYNVGSICVAFIGTFVKLEPPEKQLRAARLIIGEGVRLGKLTPDYKLYGHRQLIPSGSPGEVLYKIIQKWSHWTDEL